jgi:hypothetical protein
MLMDTRAIDIVTEAGGVPGWWADPESRKAAAAIMDRYASGKLAADPVAIAAATGLAGQWLDGCMDMVQTRAHTGFYVSQLSGHAGIDVLKAMSASVARLTAQALPETLPETMSALEGLLHTHLVTKKGKRRTMREAALDWLRRMTAPEEANVMLDWAVDCVTRDVGRIDREIIWIVAQPSVGKTAFVLQLMAVLAGQGKMTSLASLESSDESIASRFVSNIGKLNTFNIRQRRATHDEIKAAEKAAHGISDKIRVVDASMTIDQVYAWGRAEQRAGSKLLIIDNTRHIRTPGESDRVAAMALISSRCKQLRDDTRLPVVVLHHSKVDQHGNEGVSWSSDIAKDADMVIFLREITDKCTAPSTDNPDGRWCIAFDVDKHRDGRKKTRTLLEFVKSEQRFIKWESDELRAETREIDKYWEDGK